MDLVLHSLNGLGPEFKEISAGIFARDSFISFEDLHDKLIKYEELLNQEDTSKNVQIATANFTKKISSES